MDAPCSKSGAGGAARRRSQRGADQADRQGRGHPPRDVSWWRRTARIKRLVISGDGPTLVAALEKIPHRAKACQAGRIMSARIIDGKTIAADLRGKVADAVHRLRRDRGIVPGIAVVLIGDNPASQVYVRNKSKAVAESGMSAFDHKLPATASEAEAAVAHRRAQCGRRSKRHPGAAAVAETNRRAKGHRCGRSRQGCRWFPSAQCRPARQRIARAGSMYAARVRDSGQDSAAIACRPRGGCDRSVQHRRQAGGAIAAGRKCDGDNCSFQDKRSSGRVSPRRFAGCRHRSRRKWFAATGSSRARP